MMALPDFSPTLAPLVVVEVEVVLFILATTFYERL